MAHKSLSFKKKQHFLSPDRIMGIENPHEPPGVGSLPFKHQVSPLRLAVFTNHASLMV